MVDVVVTPANVVPQSGARREMVVAGATVTAGQPVYQDATSRKMLLGDASAASTATIKGLALGGGADGQPIVIATQGPVSFGAVLTEGVVYALSSTAGGIAPVSDLLAGEIVTILGVATSSSVLDLDIQNSGAAVQ